MTVDYYIQYPCKIRETITDQDLLRMEKARNRARTVLEIMRKSDQKNDTPELERSVTVVVADPQGPVEKKVKISEMLAEAEPLEMLSMHCNNCPANLRDVPFGCGGAIHYPITESTENWLVARLPNSLDEPSGRLLTMALRDFHVTGENIDASRPRKIIYSSIKPAVRTWGRFIFKKKITSSQILQMLFEVGSLQPSHARMMCLYLGFLGLDMQPSDKGENAFSPEDSYGVTEFKLFLRAAAYAGSNGYGLFIDA